MEGTKKETGTLAPDEVSIRGWVYGFGNMRRHIQSQWKIIALAMLIGGLAGLLYAVQRKTSYKAISTFVLEAGEKSGGSNLGQYSALASMVGIDVGGGGGLFQGDNILELYKSRTMIERSLLSTADFRGKKQLLIDRFMQMTNMDEQLAKKPALKNISFAVPKTKFTIDHDSIVSLIVDDINKNYLSVTKPDKKLTIISVQVKATDPLFAKAFTESIVSNVNAFYIQTKTKGLAQNLQLLQKQSDSVRSVLNRSISGAAAAEDAHPNANPLMQSTLRAPSQRRQVDVQATSAIYAEITKNLEIAKGSLQRETPLIQLIDQPVLPLPNDRVGKLKMILTGMGIAFIVAVIVLLVLRGYRGLMYN